MTLKDTTAPVVVWPVRDVTGANSLETDAQAFPVVDLIEALSATYETDVHLSGAVVHDEDGDFYDAQPRLNKPALGAVHESDGKVLVGAIFIDVDRDDHSSWGSNKEAEDAIMALFDADDEGILEHAAIYTTRAGFRAVYLAEPAIPAELYRSMMGHPGNEKYDPSGLLEWFDAGLGDKLETLGLELDPSCNQWTRCYRAPRVIRDGSPTDPAIFDTSLMLENGPLDVSEWLDGAVPEALTLAASATDLDRHPGGPLNGRAWLALGISAELNRRMPSTGSGRDKVPCLGNAIQKRLPWFESGERNTSTFEAVALMCEVLFASNLVEDGGPDYPQEVADIVYRSLRPGTEVACSTGISGTDEAVALDELWRMIEGRVGAELSKTLARDEKKAEAKEAIAAVATDGGDDLEFILMHGKSSYYVLDGRDPEDPQYMHTVNPFMLESLMLTGLGDANGEGDGPFGLEIYQTGTQKVRPTSKLLLDYGDQVTDVQIAHGLRNPQLDLTESTLKLPGVTALDAEPRFDKDIDKWLRLLAGDDADGLLDWIATVHNLTEPTCAVYLQGSSGVGKGLFMTAVAGVFGSKRTTLDEAVSRFNYRLSESPIVCLDEGMSASFDGDITAAFRRIVAERTHTVEAKGQALQTIHGCNRVIIAANNADALPLNSRHTADDLYAITGRIRWFGCDPRAAKYLKDMPKSTISRWLTHNSQPGYFAQHAAWLRENRTVDAGRRYLVEGVHRGYHDRISMTKDRRAVLEAISLAILDRTRPCHQSGIFINRHKGDRVGGMPGHIGLNLAGLRHAWIRLTETTSVPRRMYMVEALKGLTGVEMHYRPENTVMIKVPVDHLLVICDSMALDGESLRKVLTMTAAGSTFKSIKKAVWPKGSKDVD